jgi:hypothetical protein
MADFKTKGLLVDGNGAVTGNLAVAGNLTVAGDDVVTNLPFRESIALLRARLEAPVGNVLYVTGSGDDNNSGTSLSNAFANIHTALNAAQPWTTVFVKSGDYVLYEQPVTIKARVGLVGDNLRTTTIRPSQSNVDMFYVNNASYATGITFRDHTAPAAVFSYNPDGSAGFIVTSPYIQNCSSITTTGTGMRVDGNYVQGLRSMVCDSYTQTNAGGIGIHMLNRGYTQLVSVFTICCQISILAEDGGFCSITNSNTSFGTYGLVARGVSPPLYFGRFNRIEDDGTTVTYIMDNLDRRPNYGDAVMFANYNQAKCARDTGLIVDSLAIDLAYGSNTQSNFAGLQYWAQAESAIPNQATETLAAFKYAQQLATNVAAGVTITAPKQANVAQVSGTPGSYLAKIDEGFDLIANIISGGTIGITDRIVPNSYPANTDPDVNNTANLLIANKEFIQKEVIAFVNQEFPGFWDDANNFIDPANAITKCERDAGYLIDSVYFDLLHGGNRQAIMAGVYYYTFDADVTQINNQIVQTGAAYDFIGTIIDKIIKNKKVGPYDQEKCERDTGLIVDSLAFDLAYNSNTQSNFAGLQYWAQSETAIPNQSEETIAAINYAKDLASNIAVNTTISSPRQANVTQVSGDAGSEDAATRITTNFDLITDIIQNGTIGVTDRIVPNKYPANTDVNINHAANLVIANKEFIQAEVIAYVNQEYPGFFANANNFIVPENAANTCSRDVGFILDTIVFDLLHDGNRQSIQSGVYYYTFNSNVTQINDQIVQTGIAYQFIGTLIDDIVTAQVIANLYQTDVTQNTDAASAATTDQSNLVLSDINLITSIITNGPSVAEPKEPIALSASTDTDVINATKLILANKDFIKAETLAFINATLFDPPYQTTVKQNTTAAPAATSAETVEILQDINLITSIIENGPAVAEPKTPIYYTPSTDPNVINATKIILANRDYIVAETISYINQNWANISNGTVQFFTVANATPLVGNTSIVTLLETINDITFLPNIAVSFHQPSYISASGHTFEYVGSGNELATALPYAGGIPIQANEVLQSAGGQVYFTSTDQQGDFRIGSELLFNRVDGTITGETFNKSLFAVMTPYILAIEG